MRRSGGVFQHVIQVMLGIRIMMVMRRRWNMRMHHMHGWIGRHHVRIHHHELWRIMVSRRITAGRRCRRRRTRRGSSGPVNGISRWRRRKVMHHVIRHNGRPRPSAIHARHTRAAAWIGRCGWRRLVVAWGFAHGAKGDAMKRPLLLLLLYLLLPQNTQEHPVDRSAFLHTSRVSNGSRRKLTRVNEYL